MINQLGQPDFWQHMVLGAYVWMLLWVYLPEKWQLYQSKKRTLFLYVMLVAVLYDGSEYFWNMDAYGGGFQHYMKDTITDLVAVLISCLFFIIILKEKKK